MLRLSGILTAMILLIGCAGKPSYPEWYTKIHSDTERYAYGIREGGTKEEAVNNALNEIASKIRVSIKSTSTTTTNLKTSNGEEDYTKDSTQSVTNQVEKIEFSNYDVKKMKKLSDNKFIVWVAVDKPLNAKLLLSKIDTDIQKYYQLLKSEHKNPISTVKKYNSAITKIRDRNLVDCSIVKDFSPNSGVDGRVSKLLTAQKEMAKYQSNIVFSVKGDNKEYQDILIKQIASKGFRTTDGSSNITISMSVKEKELKVLGNKILKSKIHLTVKSNGTVIGQTALNVGAKSRTGYKQAREFTLRNFEKRLRDKKIIERLLGI
ncbi:MAG TPA: hypothetical protein ENK88_05505 [Campylobacterales bacterium]|nr:hypothetical protein [Campylobacterales bacterium]